MEPGEDVVAYTTMWAAIQGATSLSLSRRLNRLPFDAHHAFFDTVIDAMLRGLIE